MTAALGVYRALTGLAGITVAPLLRNLAPKGSAARAVWTGASPEVARAAGSVWVHAASLGEVLAARAWIEALECAGYRTPFLLTTRTERGLRRARVELKGRIVSRLAPHDVPRLVRGLLSAAAPARLDLIETEIWPNLILEARRRQVPVLFVSGTISERTRRRLLRAGLAGPKLLGEGVWALAQSEVHAERFRTLGIPAERVEVIGDLKVEAPSLAADSDPALRPLIVFGSLRGGEEEVAIALMRALAGRTEGPALLVAPRHSAGVARALGCFRAAGLVPVLRTESDRSRIPLDEWIATVRRSAGPAVLATHGELPAAYLRAAIAVVGGTFAPRGGHNVLEPAARGCAVMVGPYQENVVAGVEALRSESALLVANDSFEAAAEVSRLLDAPDELRRLGAGSLRAARRAGGAVARGLAAVAAFGLEP